MNKLSRRCFVKLSSVAAAALSFLGLSSVTASTTRPKIFREFILRFEEAGESDYVSLPPAIRVGKGVYISNYDWGTWPLKEGTKPTKPRVEYLRVAHAYDGQFIMPWLRSIEHLSDSVDFDTTGFEAAQLIDRKAYQVALKSWIRHQRSQRVSKVLPLP